jgi:hypothetical protein
MSNRYGWFFLFAMLAGSLAGCAPPPRTTVNVISDKFSTTTTLEGIPMLDPHNGDGLFWMLRTIIDPQAHIVLQQIYVEWTYAGPFSGRYFAADDTARPLPVELIRKEACPFGRCDRNDVLTIRIEEGTLRARAASGFEVKLSAQDGTSGVLSITPQMINAQLAAQSNLLGGAPVTGRPPATGTSVSSPTVSAVPPGPVLGISYMQVSASKINATLPDGLFIVVVTPGSPAEKAGMKKGDILISLDGKHLPDPATAKDIISSVKSGRTVKAEIQRGVDQMRLDVHM